jgi:hypothetical protein
MAYANSLGIPMWNADRWLSFTETRHDANFRNINWDSASGQLGFDLSASANSSSLSILLPLTFGSRSFNSVLVDGTSAGYTVFTVSGRQLALVSVSAGNHSFSVGYGTQPNTPTPTSVMPTSTPTSAPTPTPQPGTAPGVVRTGSVGGGTISVSVAGKFQLDFTAASGWQPTRWFDLATSSSQDLANKGGGGLGYNVLNEPAEFLYNGTWYWLNDAQDASATILEETPARLILRTQYHLRPSSSDFLVQTDYTVYASGRVAASLTVQNLSGASRTLTTVECPMLNVEDALAWTISALSNNHALAFQRSSGATPLPNLLAINYSSDTAIDSDGTTNRYWYVGNQVLAANASFTRRWELQLVPGGQTTNSLTTRVNDALATGLTVVSGGSPVGSGYDVSSAAYVLQASANSLSFYPTAAQQRHTPAFIVSNWSSSTWQVTLNGVVLASNAQPQGSQAIVNYDAGAQRLVVQYLGIIPTTATTSERTFTVTSNVSPTATPTFTPTATATSASTPTATPTNVPVDTPTTTNTPTNTATPPPTPTPTAMPMPTSSSGSIIHTTYDDFSQSCAVLNDTHASDMGGGSVILGAAFADDFDGAALDPGRWLFGSWSGGSYTPAVSSSVLTLPGGGWAHSNTTYTHGVVEAVAQFGTGAWQHVGFASDGFVGNRYFIFSTISGDGNLYARVNNNASEQNANLGPLPSGLHRYRIEWTGLDASTDRVLFYLDGVFQAQFDVTNTGAAGLLVYLSNNGTTDMRVDAAQVSPPYVVSGTYTSCVLDAGVGNVWQDISWDASVPGTASLAIQVRTSPDDSIWSEWQGVPASGGPVSPSGRYAQYKLLLTTGDNQTAPAVNSMTLTMGASSSPTNTPTAIPANTSTPVPPTDTPTPTSTPTATFTPTGVPTTNTPTPTDTPTATFTPTDVPTNTPTPMPPTPTNTPTATFTPTDVPTTNTPTPTDTPTGTFTPTDVPTNTPTTVPPTPTSTPTATFTPTTAPPTDTPTPTVTNTPPPDMIFSDGFESGDLSAWSGSATDGGDLSVTTSAALVGANGLKAAINNNTAIYVTDDMPNAETRYRARFYFDPNSITMRSSNAHYIFYGYRGTSTVVLRIELRISGGAYQLRAGLLNDGTTWSNTSWTTISDAPHFVELDWRAATAAGANNGSLTFWTDGTQRANLTGIDNDTRRIDRVRLGAVAGVDSGTRGTYYFDAFESRRQSYIGPAQSQ